MMKGFLFWALALAVAFQLGCSSKTEEAPAATPAASEATPPAEQASEQTSEQGTDYQEDEDLDAEVGEQISSDLGDESETGETLPDEPVKSTPEPVAPAETTAKSEPVVDDEAAENEETTESEAPKEEVVEAPVDTAPVMAAWVPVKKINQAPFEKGGQLLNAVYIARPKDTVASVSKMIFGADRAKDLLAANSYLGRGMKVGDKVYYNSPQRPDDRERLLTFFEDQGVAPSSYTSQAGDNIRKLAQNFLGDENSWKEIWATNPNVESKDVLPAGVTLRYWSPGTATTASPQKVAAVPVLPNKDEPSEEEGLEEDEEFDEPELPGKPMGGDAVAGAGKMPSKPEIPPPPMEEEPTPLPIMTPPPVAEAPDVPAPQPVAPPPAPKPLKEKRASVASEEESPFQLLVGAGVLLLALAGLLIVIRRRRRAKRIHVGETTQV